MKNILFVIICIFNFFFNFQLLASEQDFAFNEPFGICVTDDGSFYVTEVAGKRISCFSSSGEFIKAITNIPGYGPLKGPFDVYVSESGKFYIIDTKGCSLIVLDQDGKLIMKAGTGKATSQEGGFEEPHFITANEKNGQIYVSDTLNNRVQIFDMQGKVIKIVGSSGDTPGQFHFATGLTTDEEGNLFVMSFGGGFINIYDKNFAFKGVIGLDCNTPLFQDAYGVCLDNEGLWVADTYHNRIIHLTKQGKMLNIIGGEEGTDIHKFNHPSDMDTDAQGNLYIVDWKNNRVIKLSPEGFFQRKWGGLDTLMDYKPPKIVQRDNCRGKVNIAAYCGIDNETIDKAAKAGIDHIYPSFSNQAGEWDIKERVEYARTKGIKIFPSIAILHLGSNLPQWQMKKDLFMWKKDSNVPDMTAMSYVHPEVRRWKSQQIARQVQKNDVDGILLDYIRYPSNICGYEPAMIEAFKKETGKDASKLAVDDPEWVRFRAKYVTLFISELRYELAQLNKSVELSVFVGTNWEEDLSTVMRNWRDWVNMGIVDKIVIGVYSRDFKSFYDSAICAQNTCPEKTKICIMIACWGGNLNTQELLEKGAETVFAAGVDELSIYRGDAIEQLSLWDTIAGIAKKYKKMVR